MTDELYTCITALLPPSCAVRLTEMTVAQGYVLLQLTATAPTTACPLCAVPSSALHSRYQRQLAALPWGSLAVRIRLTVRKFVCRHPSCARRIFTERLPDLTAPYARSTTQRAAVLQTIGIALGGQAGARLAARLRFSTSPSTLLRLVRAAPVPHTPALEAVGIGEWAWRRGHRYKPGHNRLCWVSRGQQSSTPLKCVLPGNWFRSRWPSNVICKTTFPRIFDLPNRVNTDTGGEFLRMFAKVPGSSASIVRLQTNA